MNLSILHDLTPGAPYYPADRARLHFQGAMAARSARGASQATHQRLRMISAENRSAIEALHQAWLDAELRGDSSALLDLCSESPVWVPPDGPPLCGRTAILRWLDNQPHAAGLEIDIENLEIYVSGSFAWKVAAFRTTVRGPADAGRQIVTGTHAWLLRRDAQDTWRVSVVTWTIA